MIIFRSAAAGAGVRNGSGFVCIGSGFVCIGLFVSGYIDIGMFSQALLVVDYYPTDSTLKLYIFINYVDRF